MYAEEKMSLSLLLGDTYQLESKLGSGGSGIVYKAWHKRLRKHVVIKELRHSVFTDRESGRNEAEALKNTKSAYLPQVYDFMNNDNYSFTVMEYVEGESFDKLLKRGQRFTPNQVIGWFGQLSAALGELHGKNICHRDIKPANIMLTPGGSVCLIDFNAASIKGNDLRFISRSRGYASPEQYELYKLLNNENRALLPLAAGSNDSGITVIDTADNTTMDDGLTDLINAEPVESHVTLKPNNIDWKRSDIYSLGVTMSHILTCKRPAYKTDGIFIQPRSTNQKYEKPASLDSLSICLLIIECSTCMEPSGRFASAVELGYAINRMLINTAVLNNTR